MTAKDRTYDADGDWIHWTVTGGAGWKCACGWENESVHRASEHDLLGKVGIKEAASLGVEELRFELESAIEAARAEGYAAAKADANAAWQTVVGRWRLALAEAEKAGGGQYADRLAEGVKALQELGKKL